jgi:bacillithiol biosynthesis cysteine-adding enzyme BshC
VRAAIDMRQFPWIRPLVAAYANDYSSVAPMFSGDPSSPVAWRETIARVRRAPRDRDHLTAVVAAQLERRGAPPAARAAAARLQDPSSVAIVTGQQAGLFGGPLYTLLKAVTALQLATRVSQEHGTPTVTIFWIDEEDHDWDEIRSAEVLDDQLTLKKITLADLDGAGVRPVSSLVLDAGINDALTELEQTLAPTEFTGDLMAGLRAWYRPGVGVAAAFAGWIETLLGPHGLVVFEAGDPAAKPLVSDVFCRELDHPGRTASLAREAGAEMLRFGHQPQVEPADDSVGLFVVDQSGRHPVKRQDGQFTVGEAVSTPAALRAEVQSSPERFSPNVLLRPIVEETLFPTACYVGGPSELAYHAQLKGVYRAFGVEPPLLYPRASATLLDSACIRFLDKYQLPLEALHVRDDSAFNKLLESQLPPTIERALDQTSQEITRLAEAIKLEVAAVDPTLSGAVDSTVTRIHDTLKTLHHKIVQASKRKDDTLRRQFTRARSLAFPGGGPQERVLTLVYFLNRHGLSLTDRLLESLPLDTGKHYLLTL